MENEPIDNATEPVTEPVNESASVPATAKASGKMKAAKILFIVSLVIYGMITVYFAFMTGTAMIGDETTAAVGAAFTILLLLIFGSVGYAVCLVLNVVALILANVKRGERKFFGVRYIILAVAAPVTEALFAILLLYA